MVPMSIFIALTNFNYSFSKMLPISMKLYQMLRLHMMDGNSVSKKHCENWYLEKPLLLVPKELCPFHNKFLPQQSQKNLRFIFLCDKLHGTTQNEHVTVCICFHQLEYWFWDGLNKFIQNIRNLTVGPD